MRGLGLSQVRNEGMPKRRSSEPRVEEPRLPPGRYAPFGRRLRDHAGRLVAAAMSHYIERGPGTLLLSATSLEPRGFLSLKNARRFPAFSTLAREAARYSPKEQALVLAVDARHAVLFKLTPRRGQPANVDLLGGGAVTECLGLRSDTSLSHRPCECSGEAKHECDQDAPDRADLHRAVAYEVNARGSGLKSSECEEAIDGQKGYSRQQSHDEGDEHRLAHAPAFYSTGGSPALAEGGPFKPLGWG